MERDRLVSEDGWKSLAGGLRVLGAVEAALFGLAWLALGLFGFFWSWHGEIRHHSRLEAIRKGEAQPEALFIIGLHEDEDGATIHLGRKDGNKLLAMSVHSLDGLAVGQEVEAYRFEDDWFVPQFVWFPWWGKFVFLGFGLLVVPATPILIWLHRRETRLHL